MTRDEETYFLRLMQVADADELKKHFTLKSRTVNEAGVVRVDYDVTWNYDEGYLWIRFHPDPQSPPEVDEDNPTPPPTNAKYPRRIMAAEMNVGFPTLIGLNRSPLELRILVDHILDELDESAGGGK
jgi:hypothetical protein